MNLASKIKNSLKNAKRIAILGVGSQLRGDDAAGIITAEYIQNNLQNNQPNLKVFFGHSAPENLTGEIKRFKPTHLIIIDSADISAKPGAVTLLKPDELGGISFCTHQLPLQVLTDYLYKSLKCDIIIIGIQPKMLTFGHLYSKEVGATAKLISEVIIKIINPSSQPKRRKYA